jgi:hypothetical protein
MAKRMLILLTLAWVLLACQEGDLNIGVRYDQTRGLKEGGRVIFEENDIGRVKGISYSPEGHYVAHLIIKKDFSNAATEHSRFFVKEDPQEVDKKAIEMIHTQKGGALLEDGAIVDGSTQSAARIGQASGKLEEGLKGLQEEFEGFAEELKRLPETEEFKELEEELGHLADEMKRSGEAAQETIQKEWLPKLQEELERLRERFREFGREEDLEPIETQMEEIREI